MVAGPLLLLMLGSIEVARLLWIQQALNRTAISAARCVGIRNDGCARRGIYASELALAHVQAEARAWGVPLSDNAIEIRDGVACNGLPGFSAVVLTLAVDSPLPFVAEAFHLPDNRFVAKACFPTQAES